MDMELVIILVTGTPGTGKTAVSSIIADELNGSHIELSRLVKEGGLSIGWDDSRATLIADTNAIRTALENICESSKKPLVIDGHYSTDVAPPEGVSLVVVLRRAPWVLLRELRKRGYRPRKIRENVEAELLGSCLIDALNTQDPSKVCELDTTDSDPHETSRIVLRALRGEYTYGYGEVDWMSRPEAEALLREL